MLANGETQTEAQGNRRKTAEIPFFDAAIHFLARGHTSDDSEQIYGNNGKSQQTYPGSDTCRGSVHRQQKNHKAAEENLRQSTGYFLILEEAHGYFVGTDYETEKSRHAQCCSHTEAIASFQGTSALKR